MPVNLNPEDIDVSKILLLGNISALEEKIDIIDHDQNGVKALVVKFDRQVVVDYLRIIKQDEAKVPFIITGTIHGQPFKGSDIIIVNISVSEQTAE